MQENKRNNAGLHASSTSEEMLRKAQAYKKALEQGRGAAPNVSQITSARKRPVRRIWAGAAALAVCAAVAGAVLLATGEQAAQAEHSLTAATASAPQMPDLTVGRSAGAEATPGQGQAAPGHTTTTPPSASASAEDAEQAGQSTVEMAALEETGATETGGAAEQPNEMQMRFMEDIPQKTTSPDVSEIQRRLMELGYMEADEQTEYLGTVTQKALNLFEQHNGMEEHDGASAATLQALFADDAPEYIVDIGAEGEYIEEITMRLDLLGYDANVGPSFDETAQQAVAEFQRTNRVAATGVVDDETYALLFSDEALRKDGTAVGNTERGEREQQVQRLLEVAKAQLGKPYVLGAKGPGKFDCSGFVYYALNRSGYKIKYMTSAGWRKSKYKRIESMNDLQPGDICTFVGHVGIYLGNGRMIDASSSQGKIRITSDIRKTNYWRTHWDGGRRVL